MAMSKHAEKYRNDWIIAPRKRPYVPVLLGALGAVTADDQAMRILLLFAPWTANADEESNAVYYLPNLKTKEHRDWHHALRRWLWHGLPTETVKHYVCNFCFVYCLPRELQPSATLPENSDNEGEEDTIMEFDEADLLQAASTHVRGRVKRR